MDHRIWSLLHLCVGVMEHGGGGGGGGVKGGRGVDEDVQSVPLEPMLSDI